MWTVVGHKSAVSLLQRSLEKGTVSHAYLLVGQAHSGKMTLAINLAQALNCTSEDRPCGKCESCLRIAASKHSDIHIIKLDQGSEGESGGKTKISVEQIDHVLHSVNLPPFEGKQKVFIIDGFEFLSIAAANRLLKTLEEPVSRVVFVLLTTNEAMIPATIISRCQRIELSPLPYNEIGEALVNRWSVEPSKAKLLARLSAGCPGWAVNMANDETLLDQRNEWLNDWQEIMAADNERRFVFAAKFVEKFNQNRETVMQRLDLLLDWWRDVLLAKTGNIEAVKNVDREDALAKAANSYDLKSIRDFFSRVQAAEKQLRLNANPQLVIEVMMLNIPENVKVKSPTP